MTFIVDVRNVSATRCKRGAGRAVPGARPGRDVGPREGIRVADGGTTRPFGIILMVFPNGDGVTAATRDFPPPPVRVSAR